ncbi:hypothetical protein MTR67_003818 [Solanum verrucosum]|uniref:Xylanase inhibitor C-terminal domain-containing protein n=1 Tax=Solanum verrucosum TaxID=315347 RepID=A0AAF0TAS0_SOLVR|nr:hypothetical protein MTR67_003818 [Solanum verrucosum]
MFLQFVLAFSAYLHVLGTQFSQKFSSQCSVVRPQPVLVVRGSPLQPLPSQLRKLVKSRLTDRPTVRRSDHGPWSVSVDQDLLTQPLTRTTVDQHGPSFDPRFVGKDVPLNKTLLFINDQGHGGTRISTTIPFTILYTSIYEVVKTAFINALPKNVTMVDPPMKRFGACFSSKNIRSANVGPDVPVINFVFHKKSAFWRIYGGNSVVQVSEDVMCLAFVGVDQTWKPSIVIGGYQLEENL